VARTHDLHITSQTCNPLRHADVLLCLIKHGNISFIISYLSVGQRYWLCSFNNSPFFVYIMFYLQSKDRLNDVLGRIVVLGKRFSIIDLTGDTIQGNYNEKKK